MEALEEEEREVEARIKRMRIQGQERFRSLLQERLVKQRPRASSPNTAAPDQERAPSLDGGNELEGRQFCSAPFEGDCAFLQSKLSAAINSLPALLERINKCTDDLDAKITKLRRKHSYNFAFEMPHATSTPEEDLDLASRFFPTT